ncbi:hypothetical protein TNCV_778911 [Trichonephila clavipes]|nr:hypothetical protein TNCV_778911 [Trichonephila clavipes]
MSRVRYLVPLKIRHVKGLMHIKSDETQSPAIGMVVWRGGMPDQESSSSLERVTVPNVVGYIDAFQDLPCRGADLRSVMARSSPVDVMRELGEQVES